jgi:hypothetical protein
MEGTIAGSRGKGLGSPKFNVLVVLSLSVGGDMVDEAQEVSPCPPVVMLPPRGVHSGGGGSLERKRWRGVM